MELISHCCLAEVDCRNNDGNYCQECGENCEAIEKPTDKDFPQWLAERDALKVEEGYYSHKEKALKYLQESLIKYTDPKPEYSGMFAADLANKILTKGWLTIAEREEKNKNIIAGIDFTDDLKNLDNLATSTLTK